MIAPTLLGHVGAVSGSAISIRQFEGVASGISIIGGRSYRVGQVGSFVRIPQGYHDLYGIIAEVGATATPEALRNLSSRGVSEKLLRPPSSAASVSIQQSTTKCISLPRRIWQRSTERRNEAKL